MSALLGAVALALRRSTVLLLGVVVLTLALAVPARAVNDVLYPPNHLNPGNYISATGGAYPYDAFRFIMQTDGNLVLYAKSEINPGPSGDGYGRVLWNSGTWGNSVTGVYMQTDGNLVIYNTAGAAIWHTNTWGHPNAYLKMQADGNAVIYWSGAALWNTVTYNGSNTESFGDGDCWRSGTPLTCILTWVGRNTYVYFRAIDQFSSGAPGWMTGGQAAVNAWNSAPGPQFYSFTAHSNDTWVYLNDSRSGQHGLTSNIGGITWTCDSSRNCYSDESRPINISWSDVYFNHDQLDGASNTYIQYIFAHESGHAMGLIHNVTDRNSVMAYPYNTDITAPDANDIGGYPGCAAAGFGIRCIYGSGD